MRKTGTKKFSKRNNKNIHNKNKKGGVNDIEMGPPTEPKPLYSIPLDTQEVVKETIRPISPVQALEEFNKGPPASREQNERFSMFDEDPKENPMKATMLPWGQDAGKRKKRKSNRKNNSKKVRKSRKNKHSKTARKHKRV